MYIKRKSEQTLEKLKQGFPIVVITGPRQSGKTTLARHYFVDKTYVSFEDLDERTYAIKDPRGFLARFPNGAILDEIQHCPSLFSYLQTRVDEDKVMGQFILTGSQQFNLIEKITQSLAGRAGLLQLLPLDLNEAYSDRLKDEKLDDCLYRGLYPALFTRNITPELWYGNYLTTYLERDVRQLISIKDLSAFQRFIKMCAARSGQMLNLSSLGNDCGISHNTARSWISILEASYIVFLVQPHFQNFGKRLVKTPKLYFYDTGLVAHLLQIQDSKHMNIHPSRGALFETLIIGELLKQRFSKGLAPNCYYWRDNLGNEIDVILEHGEHLCPIEIKSSETVRSEFFKQLLWWQKISKKVCSTPKLIYGGENSYVRHDVEVCPWKNLLTI